MYVQQPQFLIIYRKSELFHSRIRRVRCGCAGESTPKSYRIFAESYSRAAIAYINKISDDLEKFIFAKIEARVAQNKIGG